MATRRKSTRRAPVRRARGYSRSAGRHKRKDNIHIGTALGVGIGIGIPLFEGYKAGASAQENAVNMAGSLSQAMFGYDMATKQFSSQSLQEFWVPTIGGWAVSKVAGYTGINRMLPKRVKL